MSRRKTTDIYIRLAVDDTAKFEKKTEKTNNVGCCEHIHLRFCKHAERERQGASEREKEREREREREILFKLLKQNEAYQFWGFC